MPEPRTVVVVNPKSQGGSTGKQWPELSTRLQKHFAFEDAITTAPGDATRLTREALASGAERVIALGGDGTINEVVNGFFADGAPIAPGAALGVIPYGTGGDFRRTMLLPLELDGAAKVIAADHRRPIDVGRLDYTTPEGTSASRMFANICSFGISGLIDRHINKSKKRLGRLSYALATARVTLGYTNQRVHLRFDDDPTSGIDVTINTVAVANGQFFGGGMHIAPGAEVDDGVFDVVCLGDFGKAEILLKGSRVYKGAHMTMDKVSCRRARTVDAEPTTPGEAVEIDLDGDNIGKLPARFTLLPRALQMVVPPPAA
jgi:YegS/Rv2252/BmrU family lipid kinase